MGVLQDGPFDVCPPVVEFREGFCRGGGGGGRDGDGVLGEGIVAGIVVGFFTCFGVGVGLSLLAATALDVTRLVRWERRTFTVFLS